jgi:uncharacterized protein YcbK (DUF882 family)
MMNKQTDLTMDNLSLPRRNFLGLGLASMAGLAVGGAGLVIPTDEAFAASTLLKTEKASAGMGARTLAFRHMHTNEELTVTYWRDGQYDQAGLAEINYLLRDFRTGDVKSMDRGVLNILNLVKKRLGTNQPLHIVSAYRSPKTNAMLRRNSDGGVAKRSFHLKGMAVDIRIPGVSTYGIARVAKSLGMGGVGTYGSNDFVHVDVGPPRTW